MRLNWWASEGASESVRLFDRRGHNDPGQRRKRMERFSARVLCRFLTIRRLFWGTEVVASFRLS